MKIILTLDKESIEDFKRWYISHMYYKGIGELIENVNEEEEQITKTKESAIIG
jgi:hypothetical protein